MEAIYPYEEDTLDTEDTLPQLLTIEVQGINAKKQPVADYRIGVLCHQCWHRLEDNGGIDMWIGQGCWESLDPVTPFAQLPKTLDDPEKRWDAENYNPVEISD